MRIELNNPTDITLEEASVVNIESITIGRMIDLPMEKKVFVFINELNRKVLLWEGDAYDEIGDWTNQDVENRLLELFNI